MTKAERTRQFIIEQAAVVLNKKGMAGTSISDIMEVTKLAKGGIYGNFENKDEICLEAFNFLAQQQRDVVQGVLCTQTTAKGKLFAYIDHYVRNIQKTESGGCPILNFGIEADDTNPAVKKKVGESIKAAEERLISIINEGIAGKEFRADVHAASFAVKMYTMLEGAIFVSRVLGTIDQMQMVANILKTEIETFKN